MAEKKAKFILLTEDLIVTLLYVYKGNSDDVVEDLLSRVLEDPEDDVAMASTIRQNIKNKVHSRWADSYFIEDESQTWIDRKGLDK